MKKQSYVPTTLGQYLNENRSITLTRQYGDKDAVVVGSRAPLRNQVLAYVMENAKVTRAQLKKFISGLNEGGAKPAATNMWLKRNEKFFITESKGGVTTYKLSKIGQKLASTLQPVMEAEEAEEVDETNRGAKIGYGKDLTADKVDKKYGIKKESEEELNEEGDNEDEVDEDSTCHESRQERINKLVEQIRAKRAKKLNEGGDELTEDDDEDEVVVDDDEEVADEAPAEDDVIDDVEEDDRVEISEFIITVDDVEEALEELGDLGIDASEVGMETDVEDEIDVMNDPDMSMGDMMDMGDEPAEDEVADPEAEDVEDFDLDIGGDIGGEEEVEESVTGMEDFEKSRNAKYKDSPPNLTEDDEDLEVVDDELDMDDLDEVPDVEGEEETLDTDEVGFPAEDEEGDLDDPANFEAPEGDEKQIRVSAENWEKLKGWLDAKGVDTEEMFGGEIEVEGEESVEDDEISFDGLEDIEDESPEHEAVESDEEEAAEKAEGDDDEEVEESVTGMENFEKKRDDEAGDKPANVTKTKNTNTKKLNK